MTGRGASLQVLCDQLEHTRANLTRLQAELEQLLASDNVPITATPLPEGKRPFLGGSPEQIAQDLTRVQQLNVDEIFFSDQASPTVDEAIQRLEEIQTAVRR